MLRRAAFNDKCADRLDWSRVRAAVLLRIFDEWVVYRMSHDTRRLADTNDVVQAAAHTELSYDISQLVLLSQLEIGELRG